VSHHTGAFDREADGGEGGDCGDGRHGENRAKEDGQGEDEKKKKGRAKGGT